MANARFPACVGATTCTVNAGNAGDPFLFPPAVSSNDRIDDFISGTAGSIAATDQFLVALVSGSAADDSLTEDSNYHSSVYVLIDDHTGPDKSAGFSIPAGAGLSAPGVDDNYVRMAVSEITRERNYRPFPTSPVLTQTRTFDPRTRPIRAPRIFVTGAVDEDSVGPGLSPILLDGVEIYYIEFTVYEPPSLECDADWHNDATGEWFSDPGQTYTITFRLTNSSGSPFNLTDGASDVPGLDFGGSFGSAGLQLTSVEQVGGVECQGDECGAQLQPPGGIPCDNNTDAPPSTTSSFSLTVYQSELAGFTPVE